MGNAANGYSSRSSGNEVLRIGFARYAYALGGLVTDLVEVKHGGGVLALGSPNYKDDVALRIKQIKS